jgi:hypothetical protein
MSDYGAHRSFAAWNECLPQTYGRLQRYNHTRGTRGGVHNALDRRMQGGWRVRSCPERVRSCSRVVSWHDQADGGKTERGEQLHSVPSKPKHAKGSRSCTMVPLPQLSNVPFGYVNFHHNMVTCQGPMQVHASATLKRGVVFERVFHCVLL